MSRALAGFFMGLIWLYRVALSPLFAGVCRFQPSCSHYAEEAIRLHGPGRGVVLAAHRLLRCHPFGGSGVDAVPAPPARSRGLGADLTTGCQQPVVKLTRHSTPAGSPLNRSPSARSSLRFARNTPGIPPSRALSAGPSGHQFSRWGGGARASSTTGC